MENIHGFDFQPLQFDRNGNPTSGVEELARHVRDSAATDVVFICHGFRNDENDARALYARFLDTFAGNRARPGVAPQLAPRRFAVGGAFWPSMIFPETNDSQGGAQSAGAETQDRQRLEALKAGLDPQQQARIDDMISLLSAAAGDQDAQLQMVAHLLSIVQALPSDDGNEFHSAFAQASATTLREALLAGDSLDVSPVGAGPGGADGIPGLAVQPALEGGAQSFFGTVFGFVPKFLNLTTFLLMFHRCGEVGEKGISRAVRSVRNLAPNVRVHLVGHSLGGRAVTACARGLLSDPLVQVDSMMLLQAAYSHFGLSQGGAAHPRGFFRDIIERKVVRGPILATHSEHDSVVGFAYTSMAAVSLNNAKAVGDENSRFGGIGRNGVLDTRETVQQELNLPGVPYVFSSGSIHNLNGSRKVQDKPLIASHGDVTSPAVTWAFASLVAQT